MTNECLRCCFCKPSSLFVNATCENTGACSNTLQMTPSSLHTSFSNSAVASMSYSKSCAAAALEDISHEQLVSLAVCLCVCCWSGSVRCDYYSRSYGTTPRPTADAIRQRSLVPPLAELFIGHRNNTPFEFVATALSSVCQLTSLNFHTQLPAEAQFSEHGQILHSGPLPGSRRWVATDTVCEARRLASLWSRRNYLLPARFLY